MKLLPPPAWTESEAECLGCGYSLRGLELPAVCPECGLPYSGRQYVLHGVADARSTMPPWRLVVAIGACVVFTFGGPQLLLLAGLTYSWWLPPVIIVVAIAALVMFIRSAPCSYGGTGRIVVDHAAIAVLPSAAKRPEKANQRWTVCTFSRHEQIELTQVSDTWAKLRIRKPGGGTLFSGGAQVPREMHDHTLAVLRWLITAPEDAPIPLEPELAVTPPPRINEGYPPTA